MAEHYTDEDVETAQAAVASARHDYRIAAGMGHVDPAPTELRHARAVLDAVAPAIAARALLNAAEFFETDMAQAWGGDEPWMTNGTKCARVVAAVLRECANFETEARADEIEGR